MVFRGIAIGLILAIGAGFAAPVAADGSGTVEVIRGERTRPEMAERGHNTRFINRIIFENRFGTRNGLISRKFHGRTDTTVISKRHDRKGNVITIERLGRPGIPQLRAGSAKGEVPDPFGFDDLIERRRR